MAVFLTANSPGLRTSPVKRGYWVVRRMLGEHIPAPPPEVPELPKDEAKPGELTLPQLLARHRDHKSCAACHQRFDSIGLVFEGYGPIGERRDRDLGGRPVDAKATFPDGSEGTGLDGLRRYLSERRQDEFVENLCRKLLAYALGRGLLLSDEATIKTMRGRLAADGYRFDSLVETIVTSPQFLNKRGKRRPPRMNESGVTRGQPSKTIFEPFQEPTHESPGLRIQPPHRAPRRRRCDGPSLARIASGVGRRSRARRRRRTRFPSGSPRCSWATGSTRTTGGRRVPARTWS